MTLWYGLSWMDNIREATLTPESQTKLKSLCDTGPWSYAHRYRLFWLHLNRWQVLVFIPGPQSPCDLTNTFLYKSRWRLWLVIVTLLDVGVCHLEIWTRPSAVKNCVQLLTIYWNIVMCPDGAAEVGEEGHWWTKTVLLSIVCLRGSCEMKALIINGIICIYLNWWNSDTHP